MSNDRNAFKAGLFIVISIVLIIAVVVAIKGAGQFIEPDQTRVAEFTLVDDVGGLRVGDDVRVGGVKVGIVRAIDIESADRSEDMRVIVRFNMPRRLIVREGARIAVQSTVTGTAWLNFESLGSGQPLPQDHPLPGDPSAFTVLAKSIAELSPEIQKLTSDLRTVTLPKINATADNASATIKDVQARLDGIINRSTAVADRLADAMAHLRDILGDGKGDIRETLANLSDTSESLKQKLPKLLDDFHATVTTINKELESTTGVLAELRATATNAKEATASARSLLVGNRGKIDEMIQSLKTAGDNMKFATAEIRHSPWRLLYKPKPGEVANLTLYDATRQFAEGANDLSDAAIALRDALSDPQADQAKIDDLMKRLDASFGEFQKVETDLWNRVKD